jgi:hypothetical protein
MQRVSDEQLAEYLAFALEEADKPSWFVVFQNRLESIPWLLNTCHEVTRSVNVVDVGGRDLESMLRAEQQASRPPEIDIVNGAFSTIPQAARYTLNAGRDRLLDLGRKLVFVEPATQELELRRDLPDIFSVVREVFHFTAPMYEHDDLFDTGGACRLAAIASRLPPVVTSGSAILHGGKVHFKAPPATPCPKCGTVLTRGKTTIVFEYAPSSTRHQIVDGWVCPCGESYVPGSQARAAYLRAFVIQGADTGSGEEALQARFDALAHEWQRATWSASSFTEIVEHRAYRDIIGMGQEAVPLILRDLEREPKQWGPALSAITGAQPVPKEHAGRIKEIARDWLSWAKEHGYVW